MNLEIFLCWKKQCLINPRRGRINNNAKISEVCFNWRNYYTKMLFDFSHLIVRSKNEGFSFITINQQDVVTESLFDIDNTIYQKGQYAIFRRSEWTILLNIISVEMITHMKTDIVLLLWKSSFGWVMNSFSNLLFVLYKKHYPEIFFLKF